MTTLHTVKTHNKMECESQLKITVTEQWNWTLAVQLTDPEFY